MSLLISTIGYWLADSAELYWLTDILLVFAYLNRIFGDWHEVSGYSWKIGTDFVHFIEFIIILLLT